MRRSLAISIALLLPSLRFASAAPAEHAPRLTASGTALQLPSLEGAVRGFPALRDLQGKNLADGDFSQWLEGERLHVTIIYDFGSPRRVEEKAVFTQQPEFVQEAWSWHELKD